ncbi:TauD/TfdA dioxygenase family protein [Humitalea sp. 24SJ18S-53]|uniref:TauD/TfdA dioxygenase family protein n=1 Tax=Humitalea sp. 24SJ18S-53 TaxID=3422307 RepID=UPI003D678FF2
MSLAQTTAPHRFSHPDLPWATRRLGTRVEGIDLENLSDADFARVETALLTHSVIVLPDQQLSVPGQVRFTERFGEPEISLYTEFTHPEFPALLTLSNAKRDGKAVGAARVGKHWHTDFSFMERCGYATILYGIQVTPEGGQTAFADMYAAYDALDPEMKARVDQMDVLHSYRLRYRNGGMSAEKLARTPDVVHPLVRTHPDTGRRCLFLGCTESSFAIGMELEPGQAFMRALIAHATSERFLHLHSWAPNDVLIWDNRALMHTAMPFDEEKYDRILNRTSTIGDRPFRGGAPAAQI